MFAMGKAPFLLCIWCVLYGNRSNAASVDGCLTDEPKKQVKRTRIIIIANGGTEFLQDIVALGTSRVFTHFEFDASGIARCANFEFGTQFPAVTVFYENPKFRQIELTVADRKKIKEETKPTSRNYVP